MSIEPVVLDTERVNLLTSGYLSPPLGLGFGAPQGLLITTAQLAVSPKVVGLATSHVIALRSLGGASKSCRVGGKRCRAIS